MTREIINKEFDFETSNGWVAVPRKIQDELFYTDSQYIHIFLHIILNINRKDGIYKGILVKKFQMLTGRKSLSEATGISESKIERILNKLEELKYIEQQKTTKYRLITMLYKDTIKIFEQQKTSGEQQKTASEQQATQTTSNTLNTEQTLIQKAVEEIYKLYALKEGKKKGIKKLTSYLQKSKNVESDIEKIKNHILQYNEKCKKDNYKFMKHFDTYINQEPWNDDNVEQKQELRVNIPYLAERLKNGFAIYINQAGARVAKSNIICDGGADYKLDEKQLKQLNDILGGSNE